MNPERSTGGAARPARGGIAPSEAVGRLVEGCRRRATLAHVARALCGGIAASVATLALVASGGRPWGDPEGLALGAAVGLLALVGWMRSARVSAADVAREIDRALPGAGLLAAFEGGRRGATSPVLELAARRAYRAVPRARADAAVVPVAVPFLVLPLGAVAALLLAVQMNDAAAARSRARGAALQDLARDLAAAVQQHGDVLDPVDAEALGEVAQEARAAATGEPLLSPTMLWSERIEDAARSAPPGAQEALRRLALEAELVAPESHASGGDVADGAAPGEDAGAPAAGREPGASTGRGASGPEDDGAPTDEGAPGARAAADDGAGGEATAGDGAASSSGMGAGEDAPRAADGSAPDAPESAGGERESDPVAGDAPAPDGSGAGRSGRDGPPATSPSGTPAPPTAAPARHRALVRAWLSGRG